MLEPVFPAITKRFVTRNPQYEQIISFSGAFFAVFDVLTFPYIFLDCDAIRKYSGKYYRREVLAQFAHEFVHLLRWIFIYQRNLDRANKAWQDHYRYEYWPVAIHTFLYFCLYPHYRKMGLTTLFKHGMEQELQAYKRIGL